MRAPGRRGFTLIEIMIAMTILVVVLGSFAGLTFRYIRNSENVGATMARAAAMYEQVERLTVLPFDSLTAHAGCTNQTMGTLAYQRCVTVTSVSSTRDSVLFVITPTSTLVPVKPDTTVMIRTKPPTYNPLKTS